jgi:hypothetical protein
MSGQSSGGARRELVRGGSSAGIIRQETSNHPHYEVRNLFHPGDCKVIPGRCFV